MPVVTARARATQVLTRISTQPATLVYEHVLTFVSAVPRIADGTCGAIIISARVLPPAAWTHVVGQRAPLATVKLNVHATRVMVQVVKMSE
jgi:hypothetical protein